MKRAFLLTALALVPLLGWLGACKTTSVTIPATLTPADLFQKAQEASDAGRYPLALEYYKAFQERFPDERDRNLWARYEIALLHHKMGDDATAVRMFDELLAEYSGENAAELPQGPRILAEKVKARIEAKEEGNKSGTEGAAPPG
jgi:outer membrane protein assembly factor BamD (BamD/ComL family)